MQQGAADFRLACRRGGGQCLQGLAQALERARFERAARAAEGLVDQVAQVVEAEQEDVAEQAVERQFTFAQARQYVFHGLRQGQQLVELDVAEVALEGMHHAEQFAQVCAVSGVMLQFDQQLLAAWQLLGGVEAEVLQQVAGQVGGAGHGHGRSPQGSGSEYRKP
ncbi:hypothetical protein D3C78_1292120 [compost metagenome]